MDAGRRGEELVSRFVALLIYHHHVGSRRSDKKAMRGEMEAVGDEARGLGLDLESLSSSVLGELHHRYERDTAARLHRLFAEASGIAS